MLCPLSEQIRPDIILMDISMPVMGGIEATAKISNAHPAIQIIGLSMHDDEATKTKCSPRALLDISTKLPRPAN
jgi:DNA-binding NarL/FixJ family response regulator